MKKSILLFLIILFYCSLFFGQELETDEVDEFTGSKIKTTTWKTYYAGFSQSWIYTRMRRVNDSYFIQLKLIEKDLYFSINTDDPLMIKLKNEDVIKLFTQEYEITCRGCGSIGLLGSALQGIHVSYFIGIKDLHTLLTNEVEKIRIYTSAGYIEKEIKSKNNIFLQNQIELVID